MPKTRADAISLNAITAASTARGATIQSLRLRRVPINVVERRLLDWWCGRRSRQNPSALKNDDSCRRVMTVPGIGPIISSAMVAAIGNGGAFARGSDSQLMALTSSGCPKRQLPVLTCHSPLTSATSSGSATSMAQPIFRPWNLPPRSGLEPKKSCSFSTR